VGKPPSWNDIRAAAGAFVDRWVDTTKENAEAQTFWNEFLSIFGIDRKRVASFEQRAQRSSTGSAGRIDLFWPGTLVAEHKSRGRDLGEAEAQALDYLDSMDVADFPGVVVTSDFAHLRILDLGGDNTPFTFPLTDLVTEIDRFGFIAGYSKRDFTAVAEEQANAKAALLMGRLFEQLSKNGYDGHDASVFLTRLLFLLFGDDTGMWEKSLFAEYVQSRTAVDGSDLGAALTLLFQTLDKPGDTRAKALDAFLLRFPYVNGGLFHARIDIPAFDREMRDELVACSAFDWGSISPAIFGSMFQAVKSKEARRELGEHYTSEQNILRVIGPLFLDELRDDLDKARTSIPRLKRLRTRLGALRFLDPACGCGNFLVVAYREMRTLELDVLLALRELTGEQQLTLDATLGLQVSLNQFHGIEVEEWPARIAETAMFLVDHQANLTLAHEFGQAPDRLPIEVAATIRIGNALRTDWNELLPANEDVVVLGNPPFSGRSVRSADQQSDTKHVWGKRYNVNLDYVSCWYLRTVEYLGKHAGRWAFVSTNSISQGDAVARVWKPILDAGWRCRFAHRSFRWDSEAPGRAAVHVSIVGFDRAPGSRRAELWTYPEGGAGLPTRTEVATVNPYLVDGPNLLVNSQRTPLDPQLPPALFGSMPNDAGHLVVEPSDFDTVAADAVAVTYLRPFVGARELLHGTKRWCLWLTDMTPGDVGRSPVLKTRLAAVRAARLASKNPDTVAAAATPHLFWHIAQPKTRYLSIPSVVSEHRAYVTAAYFEPHIIASNLNYVVADPDGFAFAVVSSAMFMTWMRTIGGRLKSDLRFSGTYTYNTFPMPAVSGVVRQSISQAGLAVVAARAAHPGASLADLYNPLAMPADLVAAHRALDKKVDRAFTKGLVRADTDRQRLLFLAYARLTCGDPTL